MNDSLPDALPLGLSVAGLTAIAVVAVIVIVGVIRLRRNRPRTLESVLNGIAYERIERLVIPKADEGEIQIDHLVLTAQGLLIIDIKDMESWRAIAVSGAIFLLAISVLIDRWGHVRLQYPKSLPVERDSE